MIRERHPAVADTIVTRLEEHPHTTCLNAAADAADRLAGVQWNVSEFVRSCAQTLTDAGGGPSGAGGQSRAQRAKVWVATEGLLGAPREILPGGSLATSHRARTCFDAVTTRAPCIICSHCSPHAQEDEDRPPSCSGWSCEDVWDSLPLSSRTCQCGRQLDSLDHHRAACSEARVLGRRGFPLECAAAQVCREAGAIVTTNAFVRDMDLAEYNGLDGRRLEIVDGLTLWHVRDGTARPWAAERDGVALTQVRRQKERTYPELVEREGERVSWCSPLKWEAGGRRRLYSFCVHWRSLDLSLLLSSCRIG